jgi:glycerol-3-phosphate dehydrogenase (NAD(P)+)
MMKIEKISILGTGAWGRTIGLLMSRNKLEISLWDVRENLTGELADFYTKMLKKGHFMTTNPFFEPDLKSAILNTNLIILALPTNSVRDVARKISGLIDKDCLIVIATKGIEERDNNFRLMTDIVKEEIFGNPLTGVLSGPNLSKEIQERHPAVTLIASESDELIHSVMNLMSSEIFRVYGSKDVTGVQIGGTVKNIIALAAGMLDGLGFQFNTKAALLTRGLVEITRLTEKMGGKKETIMGISGLGDLICTASSSTSRNYRAGRLFAEGNRREEIENQIGEVVEGISNSKSVLALSRNLGIEMPISQGVFNVVWMDADPLTELQSLMTRDLKFE